MTWENDLVLIYYEDGPMAFARIESILTDVKPDWYHVKLLILQIPVQVVTWILRTAYINGDEFTMGGKRMRLEKVECPDDRNEVDDDYGIEEKKNKPKKSKKMPGDGNAKVISFDSLKKKK